MAITITEKATHTTVVIRFEVTNDSGEVIYHGTVKKPQSVIQAMTKPEIKELMRQQFLAWRATQLQTPPPKPELATYEEDILPSLQAEKSGIEQRIADAQARILSLKG